MSINMDSLALPIVRIPTKPQGQLLDPHNLHGFCITYIIGNKKCQLHKTEHGLMRK